jgi:transcriptional regulator with XRE-family HTH domain
LLTSEQIRAARAMLRMDQTSLAEAAGISVETVKRIEAQDGPLKTGRVVTIHAIEKALTAAGIEFTNGDEPGVKLRAKRKR